VEATGRRNRLSTWDRVLVALGAVVLAWLFHHQLMFHSRVIDGTRYFVLDDDMMVSMRFGRNLAEGHGLVWNAGQHVEGYTNFLWTLVMAGVHLLPFGDAHAAVPVTVISWALLVATLWLALRLLRVFVPGSRLAAVLVVGGMVTCIDVVHWAAWGFETSLLGFLELVFLVCLLEGRRMRVGWVALALIPLVRSDALHLFAADAVVALVLPSRRRRQTAIVLAAALIPYVLQLIFRRIYYGDWLPNTYYLKLHLLDDRYGRGLSYVGDFLLRYGPLLVLVAIAAVALLPRDRRVIAGPVVIAASILYVVTTGGDIFYDFRFLAHVMPLVFVFAVVGVMKVGGGRRADVLVAAAVFVLVCAAPWRPQTLGDPDNNGDPQTQLVTALLIKKNANPDSRVAVIAAGIVPYFTHMESLDALGKSDRHIARLRPLPGAKVGHGKLDPAYTLSSRPDLVISYRNADYVRQQVDSRGTTDPVRRFLASAAFRSGYGPYPIQESFLLDRTAVYTHPGSPAYTGRRWRGVTVRR
jgi:arabinofuranosyltransferase